VQIVTKFTHSCSTQSDYGVKLGACVWLY